MNSRSRVTIGLILCLQLLVAVSHADTPRPGSIQGRVVDRLTGHPVLGANIAIEGTVQGSATDENGYYEIENVVEGLDVLRISHVSYR